MFIKHVTKKEFEEMYSVDGIKHETKTMHLFAGHGGGLLADLILGHTPIIAIERDSYACQVLRERSKDGWFPDLRVWEGDVRMFDPSEYAGKVDCIHAGFPCQDISVAGKQAGVSEGTRSGLYREVLRIAGVVRPKRIFLENVSAILSNGLGTVLGDLASMGYDARWCCIRASDVGAPHQRDRWFLLAADAKSQFSNGGNDNSRICLGRQTIPEFGNNHRSSDVAKSDGSQRQRNKRAERSETQYPDFGEQSWWKVESIVDRMADGISDRVHRLKGLGNAQVPLQAATAYKFLGG